MNLQESIRKILREELSARVRRRVPYDEMEKEFLESFNDAYNLTKRRKVLLAHFLYELMYTTITMMMDGHHWRFVSTFPEDVFWYDDIHTELKNHYRDRITQMYNEREGINESILREGELHLTPQKLVKNLPQELKELLFKQWGAKQNPEWHPEGNTLKHILVVIRRAYHHYPDDPNMVMAALFHDLGKIDTYKINPKTGQPTAYGHEDKSTDYVEQFRDWIESFEGTDVDEIKYLVKNHMKVKPSTWDKMRDNKKEPIMSHPAFDKLIGFTDKLDGGGTHLKESIRTILREETSIGEMMKKQIDRLGLYQFMEITGLSWVKIVSVIGVDFLSYKIMADFIPSALNNVGAFGFGEFNLYPILYNSNDGEVREISYLGVNGPIVDVWSGQNFETHEGEFQVPYYNLSDNILEQVFDIVMKVYEENK